MSEWVKLCRRTELPAEQQAKEFRVRGLTLCVATIKGQPLALDNVCPHRGGPLAEGTVEGGKIVCPWHQWEFDLTTGTATISAEIKAVTYRLRIEGDEVLADMPD